MVRANECDTRRDCVGCFGSGEKVTFRGQFQCGLCEGRGWVLTFECCSCGRPSAEVVVVGEKWYALCWREECIKKFDEGKVEEFEAIGDRVRDKETYREFGYGYGGWEEI